MIVKRTYNNSMVANWHIGFPLFRCVFLGHQWYDRRDIRSTLVQECRRCYSTLHQFHSRRSN